jgi:hypothetical protein
LPSISFSTLKDKIHSEEKRQTIRPAKTDYWLRFRKGDRLFGYWKMRTKECVKLFEGVLSEDPFTINISDFTDELMVRDGFKSLDDAMYKWFIPRYGIEPEIENFIVLRWDYLL